MNNWVTKEEFRDWDTVSTAPEQAKDLIWNYMHSLNDETREIILEDDNWVNRFKVIGTRYDSSGGLMRSYADTGVERLWNWYTGPNQEWGSDVTDLLTRLMEEKMTYNSLELAVTMAKIKILKDEGIILAYDKNGNCLIPNEKYEYVTKSEDSGGD